MKIKEVLDGGGDSGHHEGEASGQATGRGMEPDRANGQEKVGGGMLGALATPLPAYTGGQESGYRSAGHGVVTSLFQDGGELREGEGQAPSQLPEGRHGTTEVAVNPFWSENVKKEIGHYGEEVGAERGAEVRVPEQDQGQRLPSSTRSMVV